MSFRIKDVGGTVTSEQLGYAWNNNRVVNVTVGGVATRTFQYDAAGNIIQDVRAGVGTYNYTYNNANRLSTVKIGTQDKGTYTYDGLSRLARRIVQNSGSVNGNRQYIYDLYGNLIVEADDFGNTVREYIWFAQDIATSTLKTGVVPGFRPIAVVDDVDTTSPQLYNVHVDHVNRPVMMTDSTKAKVWEASYLPFGGVNTITGSASLNARFPGQWFQLESGLHYNWHRHYDATIARYTQPDPLGLIDGPSVYAYVTNSPQVYVDPDGENILFREIIKRVAASRFGKWVWDKIFKPKKTNDPSKCAAEKLDDLTGQSRIQADDALKRRGFEYKGRTPGGYQKYYHPDGSRVQIKPNGDVVRTGPKVQNPKPNVRGYKPRFGPDGKVTTSHSTGERVLN